MQARFGLLTLVVTTFLTPALHAQALDLSEPFRAGTLYKVSARTQLEGTLRPPTEPGKAAPAAIRLEGSSATDYEERVLGRGTDELVNKTIRLVERMEVKRTIAGQEQQNILRPGVRRLVVLRDKQAKAPFSPDGPLLWSEIDLIRTDIFVPLLKGLLPGAVQVGAKWKAGEAAVQELTGLERITAGGLDCTLTGVQQRGGVKQARIDFKGQVRGTNEDGPSQQDIDGYYLFDLDTNTLSFLALTGTHQLVGPDGKERGQIKGRFALHRQAVRDLPALAQTVLDGLNLIPGPENTELLFDNAELGLKFRHSRRWRVAGIKGSQVTLDTPEGHGLLVTVEPLNRMPAATAYLKESRTWLEKERGTILRVSEPRALLASLEHFGLEVKLDGQPAQMDYYLVKQPAGGVLLAARLSGADTREVRQEVAQLARSVVVGR